MLTIFSSPFNSPFNSQFHSLILKVAHISPMKTDITWTRSSFGLLPSARLSVREVQGRQSPLRAKPRLPAQCVLGSPLRCEPPLIQRQNTDINLAYVPAVVPAPGHCTEGCLPMRLSTDAGPKCIVCPQELLDRARAPAERPGRGFYGLGRQVPQQPTAPVSTGTTISTATTHLSNRAIRSDPGVKQA